MKATVTAHPVQGLIQYYGLLDNQLRLPFHDSISVCTAPLKTVTTFAFQKGKEIVIDGEIPDSQTISRIDSVVSEIKRLSGTEGEYKMVSQSNFLSNMGLGASSSGFAALTVAAAKAAGLDLSDKELSRIATRGTSSASRSLTGWFSRWRANIQEEFSHSFVIEDDLEMGMVAALVEPFESRQHNVHTGDLTFSLVECRLKLVHTFLYEMERAIKDHDVSRIGRLAERDSILVYALTTISGGALVWRPDTLRVMAAVEALREEGVECSFNIGTGPSVYVNSYPEDVPPIEERIKELGITTVTLHIGGRARLVGDHLF